MMNKFFKHLYTITKHKYYVALFLFKCGLYKRGLLHDLSKYNPVEFVPGVKYYQGTSSPIDAEKRDKGFSAAWLHHRGRNPHHWEYWLDNFSNGNITTYKIPNEYVVEMICDWLSAGITYSNTKPSFDEPYSQPLDFYIKNKKDKIILNKETKELVESYLKDIATYGINYFCKHWK